MRLHTTPKRRHQVHVILIKTHKTRLSHARPTAQSALFTTRMGSTVGHATYRRDLLHIAAGWCKQVAFQHRVHFACYDLHHVVELVLHRGGEASFASPRARQSRQCRAWQPARMHVWYKTGVMMPVWEIRCLLAAVLWSRLDLQQASWAMVAAKIKDECNICRQNQRHIRMKTYMRCVC